VGIQILLQSPLAPLRLEGAPGILHEVFKEEVCVPVIEQKVYPTIFRRMMILKAGLFVTSGG